MKIILAIIFSVSLVSAFSQDSIKINHIDSLVKIINSGHNKTEIDSVIQDKPELGLSMRSYITMVTSQGKLKKYINNVKATTLEGGVSKFLNSTNTFYFDQNKLIKVEESAGNGQQKVEFFWYYENNEPVFYTMKSENAKQRAELLLTMANAMLDKLNSK